MEALPEPSLTEVLPSELLASIVVFLAAGPQACRDLVHFAETCTAILELVSRQSNVWQRLAVVEELIVDKDSPLPYDSFAFAYGSRQSADKWVIAHCYPKTSQIRAYWFFADYTSSRYGKAAHCNGVSWLGFHTHFSVPPGTYTALIRTRALDLSATDLNWSLSAEDDPHNFVSQGTHADLFKSLAVPVSSDHWWVVRFGTITVRIATRIKLDAMGSGGAGWQVDWATLVPTPPSPSAQLSVVSKPPPQHPESKAKKTITKRTQRGH